MFIPSPHSVVPYRRRPPTSTAVPPSAATQRLEGRAALLAGSVLGCQDAAAAHGGGPVSIPIPVLLPRVPNTEQSSPAAIAAIKGMAPATRVAAARHEAATAARRIVGIPRSLGQETAAAGRRGLPRTLKPAMAVLQGTTTAQRQLQLVGEAVRTPTSQAKVSLATADAVRVTTQPHGSRPRTPSAVVSLPGVTPRAEGPTTGPPVAPTALVALILQSSLVG